MARTFLPAPAHLSFPVSHSPDGDFHLPMVLTWLWSSQGAIFVHGF